MQRSAGGQDIAGQIDAGNAGMAIARRCLVRIVAIDAFDHAPPGRTELLLDIVHRMAEDIAGRAGQRRAARELALKIRCGRGQRPVAQRGCDLTGMATETQALAVGAVAGADAVGVVAFNP